MLTLCCVETLFTVIVTAQTYVSTRFEADKILTWTPLMLVIDAGSMAQVCFLLIDDFDLISRVRHELKRGGWTPPLKKLLPPAKEKGRLQPSDYTSIEC